jgi:pilus assembly protein CpaE
MHVCLVPSSNQQLEELLRACGARVTIVNRDKLGELAAASARQPDVLVIDQRDSSTLPGDLAAVKRQHASTGILMVLPRLDPALMLEAMRAGVNECVAHPVTQDDLQAALQRIAAQRPSSRSGDVFAIVGAKGGVGATTIAVNLATMLAKLRPSSTLLVDLHLTYGDAAIFLGAEPRFTVLDALENAHRLDATFLHTLVAATRSGVQLLPSSDRTAAKAVDAARVRTLIDCAAAEYPYVVLDVPRSDAVVLDALDAAGAIVVIANQEVATVRSASRMAAALQQRYGHDRVTVAMTRYDDNADIGRQDVERVVGQRVRHVFPNNYPMAVASLNKGRPLVLDNHTKLASAFTSFARTLANIPADRPAESGASGLLKLIGRR